MNFYRDWETNGLESTGTGKHRDWGILETWVPGNTGTGEYKFGEQRDWVTYLGNMIVGKKVTGKKVTEKSNRKKVTVGK